MIEELEKLIPENLREQLGLEVLSIEQQRCVVKWATWLFGVNRPVMGTIEEVKYDGHVVLLDDGTRWEVDDVDTTTADLWSYLDKVLILDGEMWKLDESEKVAVKED